MSNLLRSHAWKNKLTSLEKDALLENLGSRLGLDYDAFRQSRVLSLLNEDEVRQLAARGADLQLHTHRHRNPADRRGFSREIVDNRRCMANLGLRPEHFGYPNGVQRKGDRQWLKELGIKSATVCQAGLAAPDSDFHSLPRVVDCFPLCQTEFQSWIYGAGALLPRRGKTDRREPQSDEVAKRTLSLRSVIDR